MSKAAKATVLLMIVTIVSKVLGLFRDSVLASAYGTESMPQYIQLPIVYRQYSLQ